MRRSPRRSRAHRLAPDARFLCDLDATAARAAYLGSVEHKTYSSPAGEPHLRRDASKCPRLPPDRWDHLTTALREAIARGCIGDALDPEGFPRYVWGKFEGSFYEARHLNTPQGAYKAYPIEPFELPEGALERMIPQDERHG